MKKTIQVFIATVLLQLTFKNTQAQNVGIGTTNPLARLHVTDSNVIFSAPYLASAPHVPISGGGRRMMWLPSLAAFRAGFVNSTQWDIDNVGEYSVAMGSATTASGVGSIAIGTGNIASGIASVAFGETATSSGNYSFSAGRFSIANDFYSVAIGFRDTANGEGAVALGTNTKASSYSLTFGASSKASDNYSLSGGYRSLAAGQASIAIGNLDTATQIGSVAFGQLSKSNGFGSFAAGIGAKATNDYSVAFGFLPIASGSSSFAAGYNASATGQGAVAFGNQSSAINSYTFAAGYNDTAMGNYSIALGNSVIARGDWAAAIGYGLLAKSRSGFVIGAYNDTAYSASITSPTSTNRIFEIGNGFSNAERKNAVTVMQSGNVGIGTTTPQQKLEVNGNIRVAVNSRAINIPAASTISYAWVHNLGYQPVLMLSLDQTGGGYCDFLGMSYNNDNNNQTTFWLTNRSTTNAATGTLRWIVVY